MDNINIYIYIDGFDIPGTNSLSWLSLAMKTPHLPTFATSSPLGSAVALEMAARARSAPLGRLKWPLEHAWLRQGARNCLAWLLENNAPANVSDFAGTLEMAGQACWHH